MLETLFYLFLAGCSDDALVCEEIASPAVTFASAEDCMIELASAVTTTQSDWPVTLGVCRASNLDRIAVRPDWLPSADAPSIVLASKSVF